MTTYYALASQLSNSDAAYQAMLSSWLSAMTGAGLVQTSDTGQVNPATAVRPAINTLPDYLVFRFNDSLQATAPIFIKMVFGSGSVLGRIAIHAQVATATDGAGNLTSPSQSVNCGPTPTSSTSDITTSWGSSPSLRHTFACHVEGFFGISWHSYEGLGAFSGFFVARTVDVAGVPTAEGFLFQSRNGGTTTSFSNYATTFKYGSPNVIVQAQPYAYCMPVGHLGSTFVGLDRQVYLMWASYPEAKPHNQLFTYRTAELTYMTPVEVTLFGAQRTYMPIGYGSAGTSDILGSTLFGYAMLWE